MKFFKSKEEKLAAKAKKIEEDRIKEEEAIRIIREEKEKQLREIPLKVVELKLRKKKANQKISTDNKRSLLLYTVALASMYAYGIVYLLTRIDYTTSMTLTDFALSICALILSILLFIFDNELVENPSFKQKCVMFFGFIAFWMIFTSLSLISINGLFELVFVLIPVATTHLIFKRNMSKVLLEYEDILFEIKKMEELKKNWVSEE